MTPAQAAKKAKKAFDLHEQALKEAMEVIRDMEPDDPPDIVAAIYHGHEGFRRLRQRTEADARKERE